MSVEPSEFILADDSYPAERPIVAVICSARHFRRGIARRNGFGNKEKRAAHARHHGSDRGGDVIPLRSARGRRPPRRTWRSCARVVGRRLATLSDPDRAAQAALDAITDGLGLSSGNISLVDVRARACRQLVPTARPRAPSPSCCATCRPSTWTRATRPPSCSPRRTALRRRHARSRAAPTSKPSGPRRASRWVAGGRRSARSRTPCCRYVPDRGPIGVMTLQWPDSREFDARLTEMLETVAVVIALVAGPHARRYASRGARGAGVQLPRAAATGGTSATVPSRLRRSKSRLQPRTAAHRTLRSVRCALEVTRGRRAHAALAGCLPQSRRPARHSRSRWPTRPASCGTRPRRTRG